MLKFMRQATYFTAATGVGTLLGFQVYLNNKARIANQQLPNLSKNTTTNPWSYGQFDGGMHKAIMNNDSREARRIIQQFPEVANLAYLDGGFGGFIEQNILDHCLRNKRFDVARVLIECGVNVASTTYYHPLREAVNQGQLELITTIVRQDPSLLSETDADGNNILFYALPYDPASSEQLAYIPTLCLLIELGVDAEHKNFRGKTIFDIMQSRGLVLDAYALRAQMAINSTKLKLSI